MKNLFIAILLLSVFLLNLESVNVYPTSDMYTDIEHAGTANVINELWVANYTPAGMFQRINLDFDIDQYLNDSFETATLNLTRFYSCPSGGSTVVKIYPISEEWDENSWSSSRHIAYHDNIYVEYLLASAGGNTISEFNLDMTDVIDQVFSNDYEFYGFVMIANNNQKFSKFYSKEHSNADYRPSLDLILTSVSNEIPEITNLALNLTAYPNPFNPTTTIEFDNHIHQEAQVSLYNIRGRLIRTLKNVKVAGDKSRVTWDGKDGNNKKVSSGIYFCKVKVGSQSNTQKLVLQK